MKKISDPKPKNLIHRIILKVIDDVLSFEMNQEVCSITGNLTL